MTPIKGLGELIGCAALTAYDDPSVWFRERARIKAVLAEHLVKQPTAHWLAILEPADVWCAEVFTWPQLLEQEGFLALGLTQEIHDSGHGKMLTTRCPIRIDGQVLLSGRGAPTLGRDTEDIVRAFDLDSAEDR
jgi:crotonobetainyl-CoA:carnitine CoA-transferase CaiB-like acyl-CoA transferase